jgi:peptidoglycan/LPS O-acetylase OafA/YrhL
MALLVLTATALPAILIAAEIIHRTIEKPGMDFGKKFDRRERPVKPDATAAVEPASGD